MIELAIMGSAIALLNAGKKVFQEGDYMPLIYTLLSGAVAALVSTLVVLAHIEVQFDILTNPVLAFILGLGGSGVYTLAKPEK